MEQKNEEGRYSNRRRVQMDGGQVRRRILRMGGERFSQGIQLPDILTIINPLLRVYK